MTIEQLIKGGVKIFGDRFVLKVSKDKLEAVLIPQDELGMKAVDLDQLLDELKTHGIEFGLLPKPIPKQDGTFQIAKGKPPIDGDDAKVKLHVMPVDAGKPEIQENADGNVNFRELRNIVNVTEGMLLLEKIPPTDGTPGKNIFGEDIKPKPGKDRKLKGGSGVAISDDGIRITSKLDGKFIMEAGKPTVHPEHVVSSDVDMSVGNIAFGGKQLTVNGEVLPGFSIKCKGDIEIMKGVNSAAIVAGGNLAIKGGVVGPDAVVKAMGNISVDFVENRCRLECLGDLSVQDYIMQSQVKVEKDLIAREKGTLIGGEFIVGGSVYVKELGSDAEVATDISVGVNPELIAKKNKLEEEISLWSGRLNELIRNSSGLEKMKKEHGKDFPEGMNEKLNKYKEVMPKLMERVNKLNEYDEKIKEELDQKVNESIYAFGKVYPGVTIRIGQAVRLTSAVDENVVIQYDKTNCDIIIRKMKPEEQ